MTDNQPEFSDGPDEGGQSVRPARRGRPRSQDTIERDEIVRKALEGGPKTKEQLVEDLSLRGQLVYLSLYRLRNSNVVERISTEDHRFAWKLIG